MQPSGSTASRCGSRKNPLLAGSDEGAAKLAAVSSLVEVWKLYAVEPRRYLEDTLTRLFNGWPKF